MAGRKGGKVERDSAVTVDLDDLIIRTAEENDEFRAELEDAEDRLGLVRDFSRVRRRRKISQTSIARQMSTTQSAISEMEKGLVEPRISTLQRYARILGYRLLMLLVKDTRASLYLDRVLHYEDTVLPSVNPRRMSNAMAVSYGEDAGVDMPKDEYGTGLENVRYVRFSRKDSPLGDSIAERITAATG